MDETNGNSQLQTTIQRVKVVTTVAYMRSGIDNRDMSRHMTIFGSKELADDLSERNGQEKRHEDEDPYKAAPAGNDE